MALRQNYRAMVFAIVAALINIAFAVWPAIPQSKGQGVFSWWSMLALVVSALYLIAAWYVDSRPSLSRTLLMVGAVSQALSSVLSGILLSPDGAIVSLGAMLVDLVPSALAFIGALMIRTTGIQHAR